jgi:hypothetical protein
MIVQMEAVPPIVDFKIEAVEYRDLNGVAHTRDVEHIYVTPSGGKNTHVAVATDWLRNKTIDAQQRPPRFPPEWLTQIQSKYDSWKRGVEIPEFGTSVRNWAAASPSEIKRCINANVLTVEALAAVSEEGLAHLGMGSRELKQKAEKWLEEKNGTGRLAEENAALRQNVTELSETVAEQGRQLQTAMSTISAMNANQPQQASGTKRRGRPGPAPEPLDDGDVIR